MRQLVKIIVVGIGLWSLTFVVPEAVEWMAKVPQQWQVLGFLVALSASISGWYLARHLPTPKPVKEVTSSRRSMSNHTV